MRPIEGRGAKKTRQINKYVCMVVEVGEVVSSKEIIERMISRTGLPTKKGTIPASYIPTSTTSLGLRMKGYKNYVRTKITNRKATHWRRIE